MLDRLLSERGWRDPIEVPSGRDHAATADRTCRLTPVVDIALPLGADLHVGGCG